MLTVLIPAHNEGSKVGQAIPQITETLNSLIGQTVAPNRIVVIADNCTDDTVALAKQQGVGVFETKENTSTKKPAALTSGSTRISLYAQMTSSLW